MWKIKNLGIPCNVPNRAELALKAIPTGILPSVAFVIYNLQDNHIEAVAEMPSPQIAEKYQLSNEECAKALSCARNRQEIHAVLAYNPVSEEVFFLDAVPDEKVLGAVMLDIVKGIMSVPNDIATITSADSLIPAALYAPNNGCGIVRDSKGRFVKRIPKASAWDEADLDAPSEIDNDNLGRKFLSLFGK